jgi:hypothetical protein
MEKDPQPSLAITLHGKSSTAVLVKTDISALPEASLSRSRLGRVPAMETKAMQALGFKT